MGTLIQFGTLHDYLKTNGYVICEKDLDKGQPIADKLNEIKHLSGESRYLVFREFIEQEDLYDPGMLQSYSALINWFQNKIPIIRLIALLELFTSHFSTIAFNVFGQILHDRISHFNSQIISGVNPGQELNQDNASIFFDNITVEKVYRNCSLDQLAILAKEFPADHHNAVIITESINCKIDDVLRHWLNRKTQDETITDTVLLRVQARINEILANYIPFHQFTPFIKTVILRRFFDEHRRRIIQPVEGHVNAGSHSTDRPNRLPEFTRDEDDNAFFIMLNFITITLSLFLKTTFKPHQKLIFTYTQMFHTGNETKKITLDSFLTDNVTDKLYEIWAGILDKIESVCQELDQHPGRLFHKDFWDYTTSVPPQFNGFKQELDHSVISTYPGGDYHELRTAFPNHKVGDLIVQSLLPGGFKEIQHIIGTWNSRIKNELKKQIH